MFKISKNKKMFNFPQVSFFTYFMLAYFFVDYILEKIEDSIKDLNKELNSNVPYIINLFILSSIILFVIIIGLMIMVWVFYPRTINLKKKNLKKIKNKRV